MTELEGFINILLVKRILIVAIIIMYIIVMILFVVVIVHKIYIELRILRRHAFKRKCIEILCRWLDNPRSNLRKPFGEMEHEIWAEVLIDLLGSMTGDVEVKIKACIKYLGLLNYYRRIAGSKVWHKRFLSIEKLGLFKIPELKEFFYVVINGDPDPRCRAKAVEALSMMADRRKDILVINSAFSSSVLLSAKFNEYIYSNAIKAFERAGATDELVATFDMMIKSPKVSEMQKKEIIEAIGSELLHAAKYIVMDCMYRNEKNAGMRITCIRALGKMGGAEMCEIISEAMLDPNWTVRAVSVKNAHLCPEDVVSSLKVALEDSNYHVRINAATALGRMGDRGFDVIKEALVSKDRFTRDVAQYVLQERLSHV